MLCVLRCGSGAWDARMSPLTAWLVACSNRVFPAAPTCSVSSRSSKRRSTKGQSAREREREAERKTERERERVRARGLFRPSKWCATPWYDSTSQLLPISFTAGRKAVQKVHCGSNEAMVDRMVFSVKFCCEVHGKGREVLRAKISLPTPPPISPIPPPPLSLSIPCAEHISLLNQLPQLWRCALAGGVIQAAVPEQRGFIAPLCIERGAFVRC